MRSRLRQIHWVLVLTAAVLIYLATLVLGLAVSFLLLAFLNDGHPASPTAVPATFLMTSFLVVVVTGYGARLVARKAERAALLHGFLVGLMVALLSLLLDLLFRRAIELVGLVFYILMVAAGVFGGVAGSRGREL